MKRLVILLATLFACNGAPIAPSLSILGVPSAHAARMVDLCGNGQATPAITAFRNANFAIHIGGNVDKNGLPTNLNQPKYEYFRPTKFSSTRWLQTQTGETWTAIPGTDYTDLTPANRAAIIRAQKKWCAQIQTTRLHLDCIMETPQGREADSATLVEELAAAGFKVMVNDGDPYAASHDNDGTAWGRANHAAAVVFIQVGVDFGQYNFSRFVYTLAVANHYVAANKSVIVGVMDVGGVNYKSAQSFFSAAIFSNPLVYGHYYTSYTEDVNAGLQIPGGKAVTEPIPQTPTQYGLNAPLGKSSIYEPTDNWFNLDISNAPLDPNSASIIATIRSYESLRGERTLYLDAMADYGMRHIVVRPDAQLYAVTFGNVSESDKGWNGKIGYPIPKEAQTDTRYIENGPDHLSDGDRHMLMYDPVNKLVYELSYAAWDGTVWRAGYGAIFKVDSNYRRAEGITSTSAGGLCVLAGLLRADEVFSDGPITHALRVSFRKTNRYVWPASHTGATDAGAPPLGTRLRLKASTDLSGIPEPYRKIFEAMKVYGLICDDRGGNLYLQGGQDARFDPAIIRPIFSRFNASNFEVIQLGWGKPQS